MAEKNGILRVFLSSTFKDLHTMRKELINQLDKALDAAAMEKFVSSGKGPQETALNELKKSDISLFLISPYYGTDIEECKFPQCTAACEMKAKKHGKISYTWCEYRVAKAENVPHLTYVIEQGWPSEDGAPKPWKMRKEVEKELCSRIHNDEAGIRKVTNDLVNLIVDKYSTGALNFEKFCGRRKELKDLFHKMRKSVNVHGIGGIGKTTLCEIVLLLHQLLGRKVVYVGLQESHASGTGYEFSSGRLIRHHVRELTVDDIAEVLSLELKGADQETKIAAILSKLEKEDTILFIDNFVENEGLKKLINRGNSLSKGCILVSSKEELKTYYRVPVEHVEEGERGSLAEVMASRVGKVLEDREKNTIGEVAEGHPVATYVLVSNVGRISLPDLESFKEGLDLSKEEDVKGYMDRVIRSSIPEAYEFLKDLAVIETEIDARCLIEAFPGSHLEKVVGDLVERHILERVDGKVVWKYHQIRDAVFEDAPEKHKLAAAYYEKKVEKYSRNEDGIERLYHLTKIQYRKELLELFVRIANSLKDEDLAMRLLPKLGEEIKKHVVNEERALLCVTLGNVYGRISQYWEKAANCKRAITAYEEALKVRTLQDFPMDYAMTQNNLGAAYRTLAEVEDKVKNCKRAITAYEEALKVRTLQDFPMNYAMTQNNLGAAYRTLAEVEDKVKNCKRAITAYEEALKVYTLQDFPMNYAMTQNNLGAAYQTLAEVEDKVKNCKRAITAYEEALKVRTLQDFPMDYAMTQNNLGAAYRILAEVEDKVKNCKRAITAYEEALKVFTREKFPEPHKTVQQNVTRLLEFCKSEDVSPNS